MEQEAYIDYKTEEAAVTCLTPDFVSIIVRGTVRVEIPFENPGNAEFFFTINIDLDTLEGLTSEEIVKDFDSLKSKFLKGDFRQIGGIEDVAKKTPLSDLIMRYRSEYQIYPYYYFTDTDFCMNLEVAGAPGWQSQCVQFALSISDAAPYLNTANKPVGALVSAANR